MFIGWFGETTPLKVELGPEPFLYCVSVIYKNVVILDIRILGLRYSKSQYSLVVIPSIIIPLNEKST